jgi:addiction module RelB/DinJ family antitoxin
MTYAVINVKSEPLLKKQAQELADELGVSLSTVINSSLRQFVRNRKLVLSEDYVPNDYLAKRILESDRAYKKSEQTSYDSLDEFKKAMQ